MNYSNPALLRIRQIVQKLGFLNATVVAYRRIFHRNYEERYDNAILQQIKPGYIVWDIGANAGHYTTKFADVAGDTGRIVAFEPAPKTFEMLQRTFKNSSEVKLEQIALGDCDGTVDFYATDSEADPYNGLTPHADSKPIKVDILRGDSFHLKNPDLTPNCIKIDVEGFEYEVLCGLTETLKLPQLKSLGIEVHFGKLNARNLQDNPTKIASLLKSNGFKMRWSDPSHIIASR